jgi:hydrogenase maturation protease
MSHVMVIGFGNRLRGDDGVGPRAAEQVAESCEHNDGIECRAVPQLAPELAADISEAHAVLFLDADAEAAPGEIREQKIQPAVEGSLATCHSLSPSQLCTLCRSVYEDSPDAFLLSLGGGHFHYSPELSDTVREAFAAFTERATRLARRLAAD